ncbi:MAG: HlyD family type I secretion periplasmic adaptor subunit [Magnetococcales bacterium]|nr:HlyD family type I secretion periplasmic adaptor subunit [Magnetococcales bacterium]
MNMGHGLRRHWEIARLAWQDENKKKPEDRIGHETAFLPAVLEITEAPPSPAGRWTIRLLIILFSIAIAWSMLGRVEIFATAQGRIIPSGRVKVIQPLESGVVSRIHVQEGEAVKAGTLLVELDPADSVADESRLRREWQESLADAARLRILGEGPEDPVNAFRPPEGLPPEMVERHRQLLHRLWSEHQAQLVELASTRRQQEARTKGIGAEIKKLEMILPLIQERVRAKESLTRTGNATRMDFLTLEQERIETEESLVGKRHERDESLAAVETLGMKIKQITAQFRQTTWSQYLEADRKAASIEQELDKARTRQKRGQLRAPEDGTVQQLKIFTEGGVVTPAQELMWIVPKDSALEVEAMVLNKDAGFIEAGQPVEIKVETFLFTRYGTLLGRVRHLSRDAVEEKPLGLVYPVRITLEQNAMRIHGKRQSLTAGMTVTAEISIGDRRIIEYLLSPILKIRKESLTEL